MITIWYCFLIDLRPVDEFRHTPIIPISEKDLQENKRKILERNRKGYYVEIKKDTLYFYGNYYYYYYKLLSFFVCNNESKLKNSTYFYKLV